ncbi:MAG: glycosyltransferase family 2 protein [Flavobacterium sp.]
MGEEPKISVIIPTFNRAHLIGDTLESVLHQTYTNWECLVVDDGSSDDTLSVVQRYHIEDNRIKFVQRPLDRTKGSSACRNIGFEQSQGDVIQWLDSDDLLLPNAFESYIKFFNESVDAVIGKVTLTDLLSGDVIKTNSLVYSHLIEDYFGGDVTFYVCGPMWRRSFLKMQPQLFKEDLPILIDWDFNLRMLCASPRLYFLKHAFILYRQHEFSLKSNKKLLQPEKLKAAFKVRYEQFNILSQNALARRSVLKRHLRDMHLYIVKFSLKVDNSEVRNEHFKKTLWLDIVLFDLLHFLKVLIGYLSYKFFGKGYRFLK